MLLANEEIKAVRILVGFVWITVACWVFHPLSRHVVDCGESDEDPDEDEEFLTGEVFLPRPAT